MLAAFGRSLLSRWLALFVRILSSLQDTSIESACYVSGCSLAGEVSVGAAVTTCIVFQLVCFWVIGSGLTMYVLTTLCVTYWHCLYHWQAFVHLEHSHDQWCVLWLSLHKLCLSYGADLVYIRHYSFHWLSCWYSCQLRFCYMHQLPLYLCYVILPMYFDVIMCVWTVVTVVAVSAFLFTLLHACASRLHPWQ